MTFHQWLSKHVKRDSPLGDLARDVQMDKKCLFLENTRMAWVAHLQTMGACNAAMATLKTAWRSYAVAKKRQ